MPTYLVHYQAFTVDGEMIGDAIVKHEQAIHTLEALDVLRVQIRTDLEPTVQFREGSKLIICNIVNLDKL